VSSQFSFSNKAKGPNVLFLFVSLRAHDFHFQTTQKACSFQHSVRMTITDRKKKACQCHEQQKTKLVLTQSNWGVWVDAATADKDELNCHSAAARPLVTHMVWICWTWKIALQLKKTHQTEDKQSCDMNEICISGQQSPNGQLRRQQ